MITGHFGFAAGSKALEPRAPLWALMIATMWLDIIFVPLVVLGVETIESPAGGGYGSSVIHANYTHSLLGALVLSAALAGLASLRWGRKVTLLLGAVAFSHWILDLVVHRADLPLLPGNAGHLPLLGFGLWKVPVLSVLVEAALLGGGTYAYWRTARRYAGHGRRQGRLTPELVAGLLLVCGLVVLGLDAAGV
jgi:membrane-bound metal-dependent hydrolase YbcI (DUF457 family)